MLTYGPPSLPISPVPDLSLVTLPRCSLLDFRDASTHAQSTRWRLPSVLAMQACGGNISSTLVTLFTATWVSQSPIFPPLLRPSLDKTYPGHSYSCEPPSSLVLWVGLYWCSLWPCTVFRGCLPVLHPGLHS